MKRQRTTYGARTTNSLSKAAKKSFVPGVTRTGGVYARLSNPGEKKWIDIFKADQACSTGQGVDETVYMTSLNEIPIGNNANQRVGAKVNLTNINVNLWFNLPGGTTTLQGSALIRVILFRDKQCNGTAAKVSDILSLTANSEYVMSHRNMYNLERFEILKDKQFILNAAAGAGSTTVDLERLIKLKWTGTCPIHFNTASSNDGSLQTIRSDNFGILIVKGPAATAVRVMAQVRTKYIDN